MKAFVFFVSLLGMVFSGCASTPTPPQVFVKPPEARSVEVFVYDQKPWAPETRKVPVEQWPGGTGDPRWYQAPAQDAPAAAQVATSAQPAVYQRYPAAVVSEYPSYPAYYPSYGGWYGGGYGGYSGYGYGPGYSTWPFSSSGTYTSFGVGYGIGFGINTYPGYYGEYGYGGGYGCRNLDHGIFGNYGPHHGGGHHR